MQQMKQEAIFCLGMVKQSKSQKAKVSKNQEMLLNQEQRMRMESMAYLPRQSVYHIEPSRKKKMVWIVLLLTVVIGGAIFYQTVK